MNEPIHILIVEDLETDFDLAQREIRKAVKNCIFQRVETRQDFLSALETFQPEVILSDYSMPRFSGLMALDLTRKNAPATPFIVWTGSLSEDIAVECMKSGANNYILKENLKRLGPAIAHALEERQLLMERRRAEELIRDLARIPEENPTPIIRAKQTGQIIYANSASGMWLDEWGASIGDFLPDDWRRLIADIYTENAKRTIDVAIQGKFYSTLIVPIQEGGYVNIYGSDITERRIAEEKYQIIFKETPVGIFQSTPQGRFINVNPAMARIYGYHSPAEMIDSMEDIANQIYTEPEERDKFTSLFDTREVVENYEWKNVRKDGTVFWTSTTARAVRDPSGKILYFEGFLQDITERKRVEEKVYAQESHFRALIENGLDNISLLAEDGTLLWENPAVNRTLGYQQDEYVGRNMFELMHPDDIGWTQNKFADLLKNPGAHETGIFRLLHQDGTWRSIEAVATNLLHEPNVQAVVINYRDITERKLAEIELKQKTDDLGLLNAINEAVILGANLNEIVNLLADRLKQVFSSEGCTFYMLDPDGQSLIMQQYNLSPTIIEKIEGLIGGTIPLARIPIKVGSFFQKALLSSRGTITNDPHEIQEWMEESFLQSVARGAFRKLIPQIYGLLDVRSAMAIPLISNGKTIGLMDVSSPNQFTESDRARIERIGRQMTSAIQRQHADERIRGSETFLQSVQNALSASIAILNEEGMIVQINSAWRMFADQNGLTHSNYGLGLNYLEICDSAKGLNAEQAPVVANAIREIISGRKPKFKIEYPCHSPEEKRWFILQITKFRDGDRIWIVLAHENITEQKRAEQALAESEALYRQAIEVAGAVPYYESYYDDGARLKYEFIGEGIREITGYSPEEFTAKLWDSLVLDVHPIRELAGYSLEEAIQRVRSGEISIWQCEHRIRHRNGEVRWVFEAAVELRDEYGVSHGSIGTYQDITERKQAEEAIRTSEERFRSLFENSPVVIWEEDFSLAKAYLEDLKSQGITDLDAYLTAHPELISDCLALVQVTNVNQTALRLYEASSKAELLGGLQNTFPAESLLGFKDELLTIAKGELNFQSESMVLTLRGNKRDVSVNWVTVPGYETDHSKVLVSLTDITERKQIESKLQSSETRYRLATLAAKDVIWEWNSDTKKLTWAENAQPAFGYLPEEVGLDESWWDERLHPEDHLHIISSLNAAMTGIDSVWSEEYRFRLKDDSYAYVSDHAYIERDFNGRVTRLIGAMSNVTERKQAEQELRDSEERFRQLANNIHEVFWITDAQSGAEIYVSPAVEKIWGRSHESLVHDPDIFMESVLPQDRPNVKQALEQQRGGKKGEIEYRITQPDGSVRWIWDRAFPIFDDVGNVSRVAGISADITERKATENALRESQVRFAGVVNSAMDAIISIDSEQRVVLFNPAAERMFGCKVIEALGQPLERFIPDRYRSAHKKHIYTFGQTGVTNRAMGHLGTLSGLRTDGTEFPIEASISHIEIGTEHLYTVILRDISERKQVEEQLRKLSRAVEQSASTIVITDTTGKIEYVNPKFMETTGYSSDEAIGQNPRILKSNHTSREEYERLWGAITSGHDWHGELLNRKKNGEFYWESAIISPIINEREEITHFVAVKEEITERKKTEAEAKRNLAELEALYENGLAVGRLLKPREIGEQIIDTFAHHLSWHHVTIRILKKGSDELELIAFSLPHMREDERTEVERNFASRINKIGQGISGWVVQNGEAVRTGNVYKHPQYVDTYEGIQSGLYMPLKIGERVIGVISVESEKADAFSVQDERLLATLGNQAAVALENAWLYQSAQQEIAERKRAQQALWASETHYRELADSITDVLFEMDYDQRYTHWNKASEMLTGIPADDAIGRSMSEIFGESEEQTRIGKIYESVLKNRQAKTFETMLVLKSSQRYFEINAYPSTRGVSVVAKDVTDRKRSEIILQKRFELMEYSAHHPLNEVVQRAMDEVGELTGSEIGFLDFMHDDQNTLDLQIWSTSTLQLFNVSASTGAHLAVDQAGVWAEAVRQRRSLIQNNYESLSHKRGLPEGHVKIVREMVIPIIRNEKIVAVMGIANKPQEYTQQDLETARRFVDYAWDVTERKRMEMALANERNLLAQRVDERTAELIKANSNLARALRVKDEFLANMSHELRTPLNAILGLSESLSEQVAGPLNEKQQKYITTISESGHHLLSLINDILDLAKIEAGQITLDINKVDVHAVCQASLRMVKQLAQKKHQEVNFMMDDNIGLIWADERRLKQMIVNLLSNAVKFTPDNGSLGLGVRAFPDENRVEISVWDNGIGISKDGLSHLFQPFVQLDSGLARESSGTGLGLALVSQMARLHGGTVSVLSKPGKGSRFTIKLPWEPVLAQYAVDRLKSTGRLVFPNSDTRNKKTILLIDDTAEVLMMVSDYLEKAGYLVVTAQDGMEGIAQASHIHPDLILMDIQMPRMDGFEATRELRSDPNFKYVPIIAFTALAMPNDRERCIEAGMDDYISKPINLKALVKMIQKCLSPGEEKTKPL